MTRVRFSRKAECDIDDLTEYIARDSEERARAFSRKIRERIAQLGSWPNMGRERPEIGAYVRSLPVPPYLVIYRAIGADVVILEIIDGRRDIGSVSYMPGHDDAGDEDPALSS